MYKLFPPTQLYSLLGQQGFARNEKNNYDNVSPGHTKTQADFEDEMSLSAGDSGSVGWHWWIKPSHPFASPCCPSPHLPGLCSACWITGGADSLTPFHFCMTQQNRPRRFLYNATDRHKQMLQTDVIKHRCDLKSPRRALGSSQTIQSTD